LDSISESESVLSPPPPRTLDELLAADQAQSQSPLPPPPPPPPEPFDEGEGFPFFLFNQPVFIRILQRRLDAEVLFSLLLTLLSKSRTEVYVLNFFREKWRKKKRETIRH
jgi:hypothetical protein